MIATGRLLFLKASQKKGLT